MQISVMPAWIASIQVRRDAFGDIHVSLDSSTPCWNDAIERFRLNRYSPFRVVFVGDYKEHERDFELEIIFASRLRGD